MDQSVKRAGANVETRHDLVAGFWGVRYQVKDVARAVAFYTQQLGLALDQQRLPAFAQVSVGHQEPGGWNRVILRVADLPARITELKQAGLHFRNEMEVGPGGKQVQIEDPDGNPIELFEPAQ